MFLLQFSLKTIIFPPIIRREQCLYESHYNQANLRIGLTCLFQMVKERFRSFCDVRKTKFFNLAFVEDVFLFDGFDMRFVA